MSVVAEIREVGCVVPNALETTSWKWMRVEEVGDVQLGRQRSPKNRSAEFPTKYLRAAFFFNEGKHTTNLASISLSKLKSLPIPIPPPVEQARIVAETERRLSIIFRKAHCAAT